MESQLLVDKRHKVILLKLGKNIRRLDRPIDQIDSATAKRKEQLH